MFEVLELFELLCWLSRYARSACTLLIATAFVSLSRVRMYWIGLYRIEVFFVEEGFVEAKIAGRNTREFKIFN